MLLVVGAFFRHHRLFLYTTFASLALILGATLLIKKQYSSEMKYLVQNARSTSLISSDRVASSIVSGVTEEQLNSELAILQSEDVLSAVADPGWKPADAKHQSRDEMRAHAKKLEKLTDHLTVDPVGKEDIMTVSYRADSAQEANDVLSALSAAYLARHERLRHPVGASVFFMEQAGLYESQWKSASQRLVDFQQLHHLVSIPDIEESLERSILATEEAIREGDLKLQESGASMGRASSILAQQSPRQQTQQRFVPSELLLQQLKISLVALSNRRTELLTRYPPTDRLVAEVDQQVADTKTAIEVEGGKQNVESTTDVNPSWQQLKTSLAQEQVNHEALRVGRVSLGQQLEQLNSRLSEAQGMALAFDQLRSQADEAQANYKAFVEKRDLAHAEDAMDESKLLNVAVMETPTFPYTPARPKPMLNLLLGIPTALFLGTAAVYFAETGRTSFATPRELETLSDYPMLATIAFVPPFGTGSHHPG